MTLQHRHLPKYRLFLCFTPAFTTKTVPSIPLTTISQAVAFLSSLPGCILLLNNEKQRFCILELIFRKALGKLEELIFLWDLSAFPEHSGKVS